MMVIIGSLSATPPPFNDEDKDKKEEEIVAVLDEGSANSATTQEHGSVYGDEEGARVSTADSEAVGGCRVPME